MVIKYPKKFKKAKSAGFDGEFDWDFLLPIFTGTRVEPMDFDAVVERRGYTLIMETKTPGKDVPLGQVITLDIQIRNGKGKTKVYIIYGKTQKTIVGMEEWSYLRSGKVVKHTVECDWKYVYSMVDAWWTIANK